MSRRPGPALGLLVAQLANVGFDRVPPITFLTIAGQVAIHYQLLASFWSPPSISSVCVSSLRVWYQDDYMRLLLASFFHLDEWHLYYNMSSMLWKGVHLERKFGGAYFLAMLAMFSILCNVVLVGLGILADQVLHDPSYLTQCAAGFSGVLFALKVVHNYTSPPGVEYVMGVIPVPTKIVCWAELVIIHILVPNSSFLGHLSGILVGLLYVAGPIKWLLSALFSALQVFGVQGYTEQLTSGRGGSGTWGGPGTASRGSNQFPGGEGQNAGYGGGFAQGGFDAARSERNLPPPPPVPPAAAVDQDLLRRRRLDRFN